MRFRIVGKGHFGTALSKVFAKNMFLEDSCVNKIEPFQPEDIFIPAVPSDVAIAVIEKSLQLSRPKAIMLVSKGIAFSRLLSVEAAKFNLPLLFLAGPNLAYEIANDMHFLSMTLAGPSQFTQSIADFLDHVICDQTEDLILPQVAGIVKNVTAFVIGHLQPTENARATLIMQGIAECAKLSRLLGSDETDLTRACIADFILTCTSDKSRNYKAGKAFKAGNVDALESQESLKSVHHVFALKGQHKMPIIDFFYNLVVQNTESLDFFQQIRHFTK